MKDECFSPPTCLEVPFDTVPLAPTRDRDALRGGLGQAQDPARRPQRQEVVIVGVAVADELVPEMLGGVDLIVDSDMFVICDWSLAASYRARLKGGPQVW